MMTSDPGTSTRTITVEINYEAIADQWAAMCPLVTAVLRWYERREPRDDTDELAEVREAIEDFLGEPVGNNLPRKK